ncbi:hypothetical protein Goarm_010585, partial [Gossypium armourianum]|nr:hypothetical protein [Gossypium armourianum]
VRNKPIEPPKKPEKAPFFLPSVPSLSGEILFTPSEANGDVKGNDVEMNDRKLDMASSPFLQLLQSSTEIKNFSAFTDYIKGLSPSALDMELRMLQIIDDENLEDLDGKPEMISIELLLDYFVCEISYKNNFEFIQAVIRLFLKIHGETIRRHPKLQGKAKKLLEIQSDVWQKIDTMFQRTRCMGYNQAELITNNNKLKLKLDSKLLAHYLIQTMMRDRIGLVRSEVDQLLV